MLEKQARTLLQTRRQIDPELADVLGNESDYATASLEADLDYVPGRFDYFLRSVSSSETAFDCAELLEKAVGLPRDEAETIAYAPLQKAAQERRRKQIDNSPHREAVSQIIRSAFGEDLGLAKRSREDRLALSNSMIEFVENAVHDARILHDYRG